MGRLPNEAHTVRPWIIHDLIPEFTLEDVWIVSTPGATADDFPRLLELLRAHAGRTSSPLTRALFAIREKLGSLLRWDGPQQTRGGQVVAVRDRAPEALRAPAAPPGLLTPAYQASDEMAAELGASTAHAVLHYGWVEIGDGHALQVAVYALPHGLLGRLYLLAILPLRRLIVWPAMLRDWERVWRDRDATGA